MNQLFINLNPSNPEEIERVCGLRGLSYDTALNFEANLSAVYGFGERFDAFNQMGLERVMRVYEKFTNQGADTYLPVPLCLTDAGFGVYINTKEVISMTTETKDSEQGFATFHAGLPQDGADIHFFHGSPSEILDHYTRLTGRSPLPPDWAFGLWMSAHRWNTQEIVEQEVSKAIACDMKPSVVVIEQWSDEATFYRFNPNHWRDPSGMIRQLHEQDIRLVLWQAPVLKKLDEGQSCPEHDSDCAYAIASDYIVKNPDGTPYTIPKGRWFGGSMIPDFTNRAACEWWFEKRRYLLDMGIDGFKTDGGEFLYDAAPCFHDGSTGADMQNGYALAYTRAYTRFIGEGRVLFSRAGCAGSQTTPIHWAGDQQSTWDELRHMLNAGLNAGLSGITFWGFDIGGFAGSLPSAELYLRAFAFACFSPIMQWHSEPVGGQFSALLPSSDAVNDRSPWNISVQSNRPEIIDICRKYVKERKKLLPYLLEEARHCSNTGRPMLAPIFYDAYSDRRAYAVSDQFMLGRHMMAAPVLWEGMSEREVYFPDGEWRDYWTGELIRGGQTRVISCGLSDIPVFTLK
jgi:alpha-D-xyloside xylohydrolase